LAQTAHLEHALIFGSRAKGNYRPGSDIDIALVGPALTDAGQRGLEERLEELMLPYSIDLCRIEIIDNPALLEHIQRVGIQVYSAG
jgi:predicted nucleotidyltransferase